MILLVGSCMHAGKTAAACALVRAATSRGLSVGVAKVTGVDMSYDTPALTTSAGIFSYTDVLRIS
mgnify:CR=1 FL=1